MKQLFLSALVLVVMASCNSSDKTAENIEADYSKPECWVQTDREINPEWVDVFWCTGTLFKEQKDSLGNDLHRIYMTDEQRQRYCDVTLSTRDMLFPDSLNFFSPCFHQFTLDVIDLPTEYFDSISNAVADEAYAMFHYYMENMNNGRPYILAGMSQGGMMTRGILKRMTDEEFSLMKAAYSLGFGLSKEDLECKHIVPAEGEFDKGVIISYNSVADDNGIWEAVWNNAVACINPVNWKTDSTSAEFDYNGMHLKAHINTSNSLIYIDGYEFGEPSAVGMENYSWFKTNLHVAEIPMYAQFIRRNALDRAYK